MAAMGLPAAFTGGKVRHAAPRRASQPLPTGPSGTPRRAKHTLVLLPLGASLLVQLAGKQGKGGKHRHAHRHAAAAAAGAMGPLACGAQLPVPAPLTPGSLSHGP